MTSFYVNDEVTYFLLFFCYRIKRDIHYYTHKQSVLDDKEVEKIVRKAVLKTMENTTFDSKQMDTLSNDVVNNCIKGLHELHKPYKYVVNCVLTQKVGAGLTSACSSFWDTKSDGHFKVSWSNDHYEVLIIVYAVAIEPSKQER